MEGSKMKIIIESLSLQNMKLLLAIINYLKVPAYVKLD